MVRAVFLATLATRAGSPPSAAQDAPTPTTRLVPIAGTLTDASGARAAARTVRFALFDDQEGGTPLSSFVTKGGDGRLRTGAGHVSDPLVDGTGVPGQLATFVSPTTLSSSVISESVTNRIGVGCPIRSADRSSVSRRATE